MTCSSFKVPIGFPIFGLAFTSNGQLVIGGGGGAGRSGVKNKLSLYKIDTRRKDLEEDASFEFSSEEDAPMSLDVHPKESTVITGVNSTQNNIKQGSNDNCRLFKILDDKLELQKAVNTLKSKQLEDYQGVVRFSFDGNLVATGTTDGKVHVFNYPELEPLCITSLTNNGEVLDVDIDLEKEKLICVLSQELKLINLRNKKNLGKVVQTINYPLKKSQGEFRAFRYGRGFTKDVGFAIVNDKKGAYIAKYDAYTFEQLKMVKVSPKPITTVALSQDGAVLALGCADLTISIVDASTLKTLDRIKEAHSFSITCIAISHDRRVVASGSADNTCRIITLPLQFPQALPINPLHTLMLALLVAGILLWLTTLINIEPYLNRGISVQETTTTTVVADVISTTEKQVMEQPTIIHKEL